MRYFLDVEFNGYQGKLISLALVSRGLKSLYLVFPRPENITPWVLENVMPYLDTVPNHIKPQRVLMDREAHQHLENFFKGDDDIEILVDWPDDIQYLSKLLLTGPGTMINIPRIRFTLERVDAWPLTDPSYVKQFHRDGNHLPEPIQHNAWWDAIALREKVLRG
jgi:hypothetical protein